jgi:hypothetical protein
LNWPAAIPKPKKQYNRKALAAHILSFTGRNSAEHLQKASDFRAENTTEVDTYEEFKRMLDEQPGFPERPLGWHARNRTKDKR